MEAAPKKKRVRRPCKPSYCEEKAALQVQLERLQAQLARLSSADSDGDGAAALRERALAHQKAENALLRGVVQRQQLALAGLQSAVGAHAASAQFPFESRIRLGADWRERHATLLALKPATLQAARAYMAERTRFLDASAPYAESARFVGAGGDLCALRLDIVPFDGASGVSAVLDALLFFLYNMEISVTEVLGDVTVREGEGIRQQGVSQNRLISTMGSAVQVEVNSATFCELVESSAGGDAVGVIAANYVDEDALYPYSPATRLRNDVVAAMTVALEPRVTVIATASGETRTHEERVVVLKRSVFMSLRRSQLPVPPHELQELRERTEGWCDAMVKTVRGILFPPPPPSPSSSSSSATPPAPPRVALHDEHALAL